MEEERKTQPKPKLYLSDAKFSGIPMDAKHCIWGMVVRDETDTYYPGMHVITCPIIHKCSDHVYESNTMIYVIVDKSL